MEEQYDGKPVEYIYDRCGNRLVRVDSDGKEEYHYNRKNQLISRKKARNLLNTGMIYKVIYWKKRVTVGKRNTVTMPLTSRQPRL